MVISHSLKFVYLGVPRTASRAMHHALLQLPGAFQSWGGIHRMTVPARARDYFTFCCVRNPYARLYSHYRCCWGRPKRWWQRRWWAGRVRVKDFREYLQMLDQQALGGSCGSKYHATLRGYTGPNRLDAVIRYENLPSSFHSLSQIPGIEQFALKHRGCALAGDWTVAYDQELAELVYKIARPDFDEFGYDRDSWRRQELGDRS